MNATEELIPELAQVIAADPSIPTGVLTPPPAVRGLLGGLVDLHTFDSAAWSAHRRLWGCRWNRIGVFLGKLELSPLGPRSYRYVPDAADPFRFVRANGEVIQPGAMVTDCGSIPRVVWSIPGLDPWTYLHSYLLHDWLFTAHHCGLPNAGTFENANLVLGEAIYTQMVASQPPYRAPEDWRVAVAVFEGVSSFVGRRVWSRPWSAEEQTAALNP